MDDNLRVGPDKLEVIVDNRQVATETVDDAEENQETQAEESNDTVDEIQELKQETEQSKEESQVVTRKMKEKQERQKHRESMQMYKSVDYSGFIERLFARGVDFLIVVGFGYFIYKKVGLTWAILYSMLFDLGLRIIMTYFLGATVGKFIFGVRVISRCSGKLSIWQTMIRELSKYLSGILLNLGYVSIIVSRRKRALHDIIAGTAVTSGGRDEAQYGKDVYRERPEKWYIAVAAPLIAIFVIAILFSTYKGADYVLNDMGMIGFTKVLDSKGVEFKYKLPSTNIGPAGMNKNVIQIGDIDGDEGYELFKESIKDDKTYIKNFRITASKPVDGDWGIVCDKPVIQYRLLDVNGDRKDELAVLYEDKMLRFYKLEGEAAEIGSVGPLQYSEIASVIKGKSAEGSLYSIYIAGDNNKLTSVFMKDGAFQSKRFDLPGAEKIISIDAGMINDKAYIIGATENGKLIFYRYENGSYNTAKEMTMPIKGKTIIFAKDINADKKDEIIIYSPENESRKSSLLAAYDVSGGNMRIVWDGGRYYKYNNSKTSLIFEDGRDSDDGKFEAYMATKSITGQDGRAGLILFENDKYIMKLNDLLRTISLSKTK